MMMTRGEKKLKIMEIMINNYTFEKSIAKFILLRKV